MSSRIDLDPIDRGTVEYLRRRRREIEALNAGNLDRDALIAAWGSTLAVVDGLLDVIDKGATSSE